MPNADVQNPPSTSAERGRTVRVKLLTAAAELIGEIGWNAVSTRNLAERAQVCPGLVHYHFDSLQTLLRQAAMHEMNHIVEHGTAMLTSGSDIDDGIEVLLSEMNTSSDSESSSLLLIEAYLAATRDAELRAQMSAAMITFRKALATALTRNGHPHPQAAAVATLAALDGLILQKGLDPDLSFDDVITVLRRLTISDQEGAPR